MLSVRTLSSLVYAAKTFGSAYLTTLSEGAMIGHTFSQRWQSIHVSILTSGYQKPSKSVLNVIEPLGHTSPQALHPQQSILFFIWIIYSIDSMC